MKATLNDLLNAKGVSEPLQGAVKALIDRLEAAESDGLEQARLNGIGAEKELALMAKLEAAEKEIRLLRAKVETMEKQEPVGCVESLFDDYVIIYNNYDRTAPVYLAPGAQPAPSIPEGWKLVPVEPTEKMKHAGRAAAWSGAVAYNETRDIYKAMLEAAPQ